MGFMESGSKKVYEIERNIILESVIRKRIPLVVGTSSSSVTVDSASIKILDYKIILVQNPPASLFDFSGENVVVSFVYNSVPYSFQSVLKKVSAGMAFVMPESLDFCAEQDAACRKISSDFSVELFFERDERAKDGTVFRNKRTVECRVCDCAMSGGGMDSSPESIAASYFDAIGRGGCSGADVVFLSKEKIALGFGSMLFDAEVGDEFAAWLKFPLKRPLNERKIYVSFVVERVLRAPVGEGFCLFGKFSGIKLEDLRFLDDMVG